MALLALMPAVITYADSPSRGPLAAFLAPTAIVVDLSAALTVDDGLPYLQDDPNVGQQWPIWTPIQL